MHLKSLVVAASLLVFSSCSQSEAASVAGTYSIEVDKTVEGIIATTPDAANKSAEEKAELKKMMTGMFAKMTVSLKPDLTYVSEAEMNVMGASKKSSSKGTWAIQNGSITMNQTHEDGKEKKDTTTATYKDGVMEVTKEEKGQKRTIYLKKN